MATAEEELNAFLQNAKTIASDLTDHSQRLMTDAILTLERGLFIRTFGSNYQDTVLSTTPLDFSQALAQASPVPALPPSPLGAVPTPGVIGEVSQQVMTAFPEFPSLNFPRFAYPAIAELDAFVADVPVVEGVMEAPTPPSLVSRVTTYGRLPYTTVEAPAPMPVIAGGLSVTAVNSIAPSVAADAFPDWLTLLFDGTPPFAGLNSLLDPAATDDSRLDAALAQVLAVAIRALTTEYQPVLAFHDALRQRFEERLEAAQAPAQAAQADRSGWGRPAAAQAALEQWIHRQTQSGSAQARSLVDVGTLELSKQFLEACGTTLADLLNHANSLKEQEIKALFAAYQFSLRYAKKAADWAKQRHALAVSEQAMTLAQSNAEIALYEAHLLADSLRYESAQTLLQVEQGRQAQEGYQIRDYQNEAKNAEQAVRRWAAQIAARQKEIAIGDAAIERFEWKLQAFEAENATRQAVIDLRLAELEGDREKIAAQQEKLNAWQSKQRGLQARLNTLTTVTEAQSQRNEAVISTFREQAKAMLAPIEQQTLRARYDLKAYQAQVDDVLTDARLLIKAADLEMDFEAQRQNGLLSAYKATQEQNVEIVQLELDRVRALADTLQTGGEILARMASGAMTAVQAVANVVIEES